MLKSYKLYIWLLIKFSASKDQLRFIVEYIFTVSLHIFRYIYILFEICNLCSDLYQYLGLL